MTNVQDGHFLKLCNIGFEYWNQIVSCDIQDENMNWNCQQKRQEIQAKLLLLYGTESTVIIQYWKKRL